MNKLKERSIKYGKAGKERLEIAQNKIEERYINNEENDVWQVISPSGDTILHGWDQITVLSKVEDESKVRETLENAIKQ